MLFKGLFVLWTFSTLVSAAVFIERDEANVVLHRSRRANTGFLEELKQGNLERECIEEICDYEEAREVFEDVDKTNAFWSTYNQSDPCKVNPCLNDGICVYMDNSYLCVCADGYEGKHCQTQFEDTLKCLYLNGGCEHFCDGSGAFRKCSCAPGYALGEDARECVAQVQYPCGQIHNKTDEAETRLVGGTHCAKGDCPWQVLIQYAGSSHCGGVLVHPDWIITAANCVHMKDPASLTVVAGEHNLEKEDGTEQRIPVSTAIAHERYDPATGDSDIALLRLSRAVTLDPHATPICLPEEQFFRSEMTAIRFHTISGWGRRTNGGNEEPLSDHLLAFSSPVLRKLEVPTWPNSDCTQKSGFNFTDNMLCAGWLEGNAEACKGDDGSPLVTLYKNTHFLMGVAGWGKGCPKRGYYGVYANMVHYLDWVKKTMEAPLNVTMTSDKAAPVLLEQKPV